jgi:hypothetical protein
MRAGDGPTPAAAGGAVRAAWRGLSGGWGVWRDAPHAAPREAHTHMRAHAVARTQPPRVTHCGARALQVLDAQDADALLTLLTSDPTAWTPDELAAAAAASLACLGDTPPSGGTSLARLFAAVGAAAAAAAAAAADASGGGAGVAAAGSSAPSSSSVLSSSAAGRLLLALAGVPGYAPDAQVRGGWLCCGCGCAWRGGGGGRWPRLYTHCMLPAYAP